MAVCKIFNTIVKTIDLNSPSHCAFINQTEMLLQNLNAASKLLKYSLSKHHILLTCCFQQSLIFC